ncbi:uncharacterized protein LOC109600338 isoform X2 [Aethina tumida]|uniref:uncharacterized protein LOC109600338 isoform X2 n=1 Tax=Aethina tumida TaxID=116153 RepID=UPI002148A018|nr:uncharacterized protein LOC109600338 isoform X2 [Aethina tumida]
MMVIWTAIVFCLLQGVTSLHIVDFRVPSLVVRNQNVRLECTYDMDGEILYSVKWYKDGQEFYRFVPRDHPQTQWFSQMGVTVDMHNSTDTAVVLQSVQLTTTGTYKCEVSGEAPFFETVAERSQMVVVALPDEGPKITGGKVRYQIGDMVRVNCTSGRSKPAVQLNWMINGEPADPKFLRGPETITTGREGLETTILGLEFAAKHKHFKKGNMKLKCLATISSLYLVSNEESAEGERPQKASVLESRGTVAPSGSRADRVQAANSPANLLPHLSLVLVSYCLVLLTTS